MAEIARHGRKVRCDQPAVLPDTIKGGAAEGKDSIAKANG